MDAPLLGLRYGAMVPMDTEMGTYQTREQYMQALEANRRREIRKRREYFGGQQFSKSNQECYAEMVKENAQSQVGGEKSIVRAIYERSLPEHLRLHAYSTQIRKAVNFVADRLSADFSLVCTNAAVQEVLDTALDSSPELSGTKDDDEATVVNVVRESVKVGDVPVLIRWDPIERTCWLEFWNSEMVEMRFERGRPDRLERVIVEEHDWLPDAQGGERPARIRRVWRVTTRIANEDEVDLDANTEPVIRTECVEEKFEIAEGLEPRLVETIPWGVPFLPWWPLRGDMQELRAERGESLINQQAMDSADRYNAVEQVAWLIARYNSHGNLVVTGNEALLQSQTSRLAKDVADVLLFPGGTDAKSITLPTDPAMIEHQRKALLQGLYEAMGVTQVDAGSVDTVGGQPSGYALEILNSESEGTFGRVRLQLLRDWKKLLNRVLDCTAFWQTSARPGVSSLFDSALLAQDGGPEDTNLSINPQAVYPQRGMVIRMGTGYIVDDVKIRDDFVAGLISIQEALRQRGYGEDEIKAIVAELREQERVKAQTRGLEFGETGTEAGNPDTFDPTDPQTNNLFTGGTLNNAQRSA